MQNIVGYGLDAILRAASVIGKKDGKGGHLVTADLYDETQVTRTRAVAVGLGAGVQTLQVYTVPADNIYVITAIEYHIGAGAVAWLDYLVISGANTYILSIFTPAAPNVGFSVTMKIPCKAGDQLRVQGQVTAAGTSFDASLFGYLIPTT